METKTNKKVPGPRLETQSPLSWNFNWDSRAPDGVLNGQSHSHSEQSNMQIDGSCGVVLGLRKLEWSAGVMVNSSFKAWRSNRSWQIHKNVVMEQNQGIPNTPKCILTTGVNFLRIPPDIIICQDLETLQVVKCLVWIGMIHGSWFTLLYFWCRFHLNHFALGLRYIWAYSIPIILTSNTV